MNRPPRLAYLETRGVALVSRAAKERTADGRVEIETSIRRLRSSFDPSFAFLPLRPSLPPSSPFLSLYLSIYLPLSPTLRREIVTAMIFTGTLIITIGALIQTAGRGCRLSRPIRDETLRIDGLTSASASPIDRQRCAGGEGTHTHEALSRSLVSLSGILISPSSRVASFVVIARALASPSAETRSRGRREFGSRFHPGDFAGLTTSFGWARTAIALLAKGQVCNSSKFSAGERNRRANSLSAFGATFDIVRNIARGTRVIRAGRRRPRPVGSFGDNVRGMLSRAVIGSGKRVQRR